jgi:raffinose synthase
MKNKIFLLIGLQVVLSIGLVFAQKTITSMVNPKGMSISYKGKTRLQGGKPQLENNAIKNTLSEPNSVVFQYAELPDLKVLMNTENENVFGLTMSLSNGGERNGKEIAGFFFDEIPGFKTGVEIWRYKPWNSWTKPIRVNSPGELHDWDVQFFYWKYSDGVYGAAMPLSGNGYRTTLGSEKGKFGSKSLTYTDKASAKDIPLMAVGFGENPYQLFEQLYRAGLKMMGKAENLRSKKSYPKQFDYIGWCTWNSLGSKKLDEQHVLDGVSSFTKNNFPLGWLLIDDGWLSTNNGKLNSFTPNPQKFPNGFKPLISKLKKENGIKHVGIWHAYNGYWNGINPDSAIGIMFKNDLFTYKDNANTLSFIKADSLALNKFYDNWHTHLANEGISFIKVDNQLVGERMCVDNYPLDFLSKKMHEALNTSVFKHFDGGLINCMDMTNEAFYNFGNSAIARGVEDYFPERDGGVGYNLEKGGAAAHVLMALYNSLYFSQMVWSDFDMFESHNSGGTFHAVARAISGGPVYVTDIPGEQKFDILWPLIDNTGRILRADKPAMVSEECLFQIQEKKPLKAFSFAGNAGLLAVFNAADADSIEGKISPADVDGIVGNSFAVYEFFSKQLSVLKLTDSKQIKLSRMGCQYYNIVPVNNGIAIIGLVNKYNATKTILNSKQTNKKIEVRLLEGGTFKALLPSKPISAKVNGIPVKESDFQNGVWTATIVSGKAKETVLTINF